MKIRTGESESALLEPSPTILPRSARLRMPEEDYAAPGDELEGHTRPTIEPPGARTQKRAEAEREEEQSDDLTAESPLPKKGAARAAKRSDVRWTSNDVYGAFSIEKFASAGGLTYTHEDAAGFINFLGGTGPANFWYQDAGVQPWAYYEQYDNWQDTYGMDAVLAVYHSGHGTMDGNGVFFAPLGAAWGSLGSWVRSDQMRLGNEQVNYIFWSTCLSCRVLDGHNPIRTWRPANGGFRMLFGFETVSWDNPNYGKFFGEEWRKGKSLSTAWMDASWRIAHDQAPAVVACGATAAEAQNRLYNERFFDWNHVSNAWWWWRWYYAASSATLAGVRRAIVTRPREILTARLRAPSLDANTAGALAKRLGLRISTSAKALRDGSMVFGNDDIRLGIGPDGSFDARFARTNAQNRAQITTDRALAVARDFVGQLQLDQSSEVALDRVRHTYEAGATGKGAGSIEGPFVTETTVQFKQVINGIPVVAPGAGELRVTVDNDGNVVALHSSILEVEGLHEAGPPGNAPAGSTSGGELPRLNGAAFDVEDVLSAAWSRQLAALALRGTVPLRVTVLPGSTEIGYAIRGTQALLVAQRAIEVDFGHGLRKRYWITTPITE